MKISVTARIPFPRSLVFATYRDKVVELVPYMPNVRQVEIQGRVQEGDRISCTNIWHGGGDIPAAARAILDESMLSWTEQAAYEANTFKTIWQIQTHAFTEAVYCTGQNEFFEEANGTIIESRGELRIDPSQIPGVPSFVAAMIGKVVEDFLHKKIAPNLLQMSDGVRLYLENQAVDLGLRTTS